MGARKSSNRTSRNYFEEYIYDGKVRYIEYADTPEVYKRISQRIWYRRRLHMHTKPIMIIYFDGTFGFVANGVLYLRHGIQKFINRIKDRFQIAIAINYSIKGCTTLADILLKKSIHFDALYHIKKITPMWIGVFYDQIYKDFKINQGDVLLKVCVLTSVNLDNQYAKYATRDQIIFEDERVNRFNSHNECNCHGVPLPSKRYKNVPVTLLIQNPMMNSFFWSMSLKYLKITQNDEKLNTIFSFKYNNWALGSAQFLRNKDSHYRNNNDDVIIEEKITRY